jgi:hypothetical protein
MLLISSTQKIEVFGYDATSLGKELPRLERNIMLSSLWSSRPRIAAMETNRLFAVGTGDESSD